MGITVIQGYWFKQAFDEEEEQFHREVSIALFDVAGKLFEINQTPVPAENPIRQLSTNYFVVRIDNEINANTLEFLLRTEFEKRNIKADFEYGIYDCDTDQMVYGNYVSWQDKVEESSPKNLPKWINQPYYFGVNFPEKASMLVNRLDIWIFSSAVLLVVVVFFAYALFIILKQKRLSEIQKDFINNMTHEFKTPISTIAISSEVLKDPTIVDNPDRVLRYATIIENENQRMKKQVERVLQMASLDKHSIGLKKEKIDINQVLHDACKSLELALKESGGLINFTEKTGKSEIEGDKLHMTNMFFNLLDNAIKYCVQRPIIKIQTLNTGKGVTTTIEDNGIGIGKENQRKIFSRFFRVPTGNLHDVKGFGLGLSYVQLIAKAHRGSVHLQSTEGKGSIFTVYLPFKS